MTPLTASEWLKENYPNATGWHEDYATEYADYYAREQALKFLKWAESDLELYNTDGWVHPSEDMPMSEQDLYNQFLTEQNQTDARTESN